MSDHSTVGWMVLVSSLRLVDEDGQSAYCGTQAVLRSDSGTLSVLALLTELPLQSARNAVSIVYCTSPFRSAEQPSIASSARESAATRSSAIACLTAPTAHLWQHCPKQSTPSTPCYLIVQGTDGAW